MPRTELPIMVSDPAGQSVTAFVVSVTAANGAQFDNEGRVRLLVTNGTGASITLTARTPIQVRDGSGTPLDVSERTITVPAGQTWLWGKFDASIYNQPDSKVYIDTTGTISIIAFK